MVNLIKRIERVLEVANKIDFALFESHKEN